MNAQLNQSNPFQIGMAMHGGFFAGSINVDGCLRGIIVAPKAEGQYPKDIRWGLLKNVAGATSFNNGLRNTEAMAAAGSKLAIWARGLRIGDFDDWYLMSQDETEICYRNLKPTTDKNSLYARSGINVSAVPPTYPYTVDFPAQTSVDLFRDGGAEAFDPVAYWTSTQHAADSDCAYYQNFNDGSQCHYHKANELRARVVRSIKL